MSLACELIPITKIGERPGSGSISFGKSGPSGTRKWVVPWQLPDGLDFIGYVQQLLGQTYLGPNGTPTVTSPDIYSPQLPFLYCQEVDVEGEDIYGTDYWGRITYRRAILTAKYSPYELGESFHLAAQVLSFKDGNFTFIGPPDLPPKRPDVATDDFNQVIQQFQLQQQAIKTFLNDGKGVVGNFLVQQAGGLQQAIDQQLQVWISRQDGVNQTIAQYVTDLQAWALKFGDRVASIGITEDYYQSLIAGGKTANVTSSVGKIIPLGEYTLERHQVLAPDFYTYIALMGCVNNGYFLGFTPWTLLFSGIEGKRTVMPNGMRRWDLTLKFVFNPNGHNLLFRPEYGRWEMIVTAKASMERYWTSRQADQAEVNAPLHRWLYDPADFSPFLVYN